MTELLLPELARENAASNRRAAMLVELAARRLQERAQSLAQREQLNDEMLSLQRSRSRNARETLDYTLSKADELRGFWPKVLCSFGEGLEGGEARQTLQAIQAMFDSWFVLEKVTRELWSTPGPGRSTCVDLGPLDDACRHIDELNRKATELLSFVSRPLAPVDAAVLASARQTIAEGRFKSPDAIRSRSRERRDGSAMPFGVVHVVYVDHEKTPSRDG